MIHQPWGGAQGTATDIQIQAKEIDRLKTALNKILGRHCEKDPEIVSKNADRDFFMSASEAKEYGLVDQVVESLKK
jgi:ATP-dependent Clp protease protease subunit